MHLKIQSEIVIDRPVADVFRFVATDHRENHSRWDVAVSRLEAITPGPMGLGARFTIIRRNLGREEARTFEITEWDPPRRMTMTTASPDFTLSLTGDFIALGPSSTRHVLTGEADIHGPRAALVPLMKVKFSRDIRENLRRIKALVGSEALVLADA